MKPDSAIHDPKYMLGTKEHRIFLQSVQEDLLHFGHRFPVPGGGAYWLDDQGQPDPSRGIHTWITSRMAHAYSLGIIAHHRGSQACVDAALEGLTGALHDDIHGGWFASIDPDGTPHGDKLCYAHACVMLAGASARCVKRPLAQALLDEAIHIFLTYFWDESEGLAVDTWNREFTSLDPYRGVNANMHTTEAFLALADCLGDDVWRQRAGRIIRHVIEWSEENSWRVPEHFSAHWIAQLEFNDDNKDDQFKPYGATPGHGIEWSRLIVQYALSDCSINEAEKQRLLNSAESLFNRAVTDGWTSAHRGNPGLMYTTDWSGRAVVTDRMHWTLAEGVNAAASLYQVTGKAVYAQWYERFWAYIDHFIMDHVHGSWFHQLDAHNTLIHTVWPGKPDLYHALQSTLIPLLDPATSVVVAYHSRVS